MIKVLIVDDEYLVRTGLKEIIDWESLGFEVVGEAANGKEGCEKYFDLKPDIIITDIRMKIMTGIEMLENLKKSDDFNAEVIILTAFDEFDYAKSALENGAIGYILKPVKENELLSLLMRAKERCEIKAKNDFLINHAKSHVDQMKNAFIISMLTDETADETEIYEKCKFFNIEIPDKRYTVASIKADKPKNFASYAEIYDAIESIVNNCEKNYENPKTLICKMDEANIVLIIFHYDDNYKMLQSTFSVLMNFFSEIKEQFEAITNETLSIGYSLEHKGLGDLPAAYNEARRAQDYRYYWGDNSIIDYAVVPKKTGEAPIFTNSDIDTLISALNTGDLKTSKKITKDFFDRIRTNPYEDMAYIKEIVLEVSIVVLRSVVSDVEMINKIFGRKIIPYCEIERLGTLDELEKWFNDIIGVLFEKYCESKAVNIKRYTKEINNAKKIIESDFAKNINVAYVADKLYISSYYLMHLFKQETGMTFNEYLTKVRIDKAKEYIKTSHYKIYEICELVGYKDKTYFNYVFKKITGMTPKKYGQEWYENEN